MSDERDRARARGEAPEDRRGFVLVEASAGTGKTSVLVERAVNYVVSGERRLSEIAVVTFTELAAAELKVRLRDALERRLGEAGAAAEATRQRLAQALVDLETAAVGTIHGFAADLLRDRPVESGVDPGFAVADELGQRLLFAEAWEEFLRSVASSDDPGLEAAIDLGLDREPELRKAAWTIFRELRQGVTLPEPLSADTLRLAERQLEVVTTLERAEGMAQRGGKLRAALAVALPAFRNLLPLAERDAAHRWLVEPPKLPRRNLGVTSVEAQAKALNERAHELSTALRGDLAHDRLARLAEWLGGVRHRYERLTVEGGRLDFDQLLEKALDLVRGDEAVRREFQRRYPVLLVDEFQDTDRVQTALLLALAGHAGDAATRDGARVEESGDKPRGLFVVGDPKQSIYRFRGADVENYSRLRDLGGARTLRLRRSFRPVPELALWTNEVMARVMAPAGDLVRHPDAVDYQELESAGGIAAGAGPRGVLYLELEPPPAPSVRAVRRAEARGFARLARRLVASDSGHALVRARGGSMRPARYGDIALLLPAMTTFPPYEEAFAREGVPVRVEAGRHYYKRDEVHTLVQVLTALADPGDTVATVAVLRGPGFGCSDEELLAYALLEPRPRFDLRSGASPERLMTSPRPAAAARVAESLERLRLLRASVLALSVPDLVAATVEALGLLPYFALQSSGEQRVGNLRKAVDVARRMEGQGVDSLPSFVRSLAVLYDEQIPEPDAFVRESSGEALRVLTIHAAKGLEFPVVFLGGLVGQTGGPRDGLKIHGGELKLGDHDAVATRGYAAAKEDDRRRDENERKRQLYVAVTRARDLLILPHLAAEDGRKPIKLSPLFEQLYGAGRGGPGNLGPARDVVSVLAAAALPARAEPPTPPLDLERLASLPPNHDAARVRGAELAAARAMAGTGRAHLLRPSGLEAPSAGGRAATPAPAEAQLAARSRALRVGDAAHAWVAGALRDPIDAAASYELERVAPELRGVVESLARSFLSSPLADRARRVAASDRCVEEPIAVATPAGVLDARIDLAFIEDAEWIVVDLKSDRLEKREIAERASRHAAQTALYAAGLERVTGRAVREVHVFFMDKGEDVRFEGAELERLRREAEALLDAAPS